MNTKNKSKLLIKNSKTKLKQICFIINLQKKVIKMNIQKLIRHYILGDPFYINRTKLINLLESNSRFLILIAVFSFIIFLFLIFGIFRNKIHLFQVVFFLFFTAILFQKIHKTRFYILHRNMKKTNNNFKESLLYENWRSIEQSFLIRFFNKNLSNEDSKESSNEESSTKTIINIFLERVKKKLLELRDTDKLYNEYLRDQNKLRDDILINFEKFKYEFMRFANEIKEFDKKLVDHDIVMDLYLKSLNDLETELQSRFVLRNTNVRVEFVEKKQFSSFEKNMKNLDVLEIYILIQAIFGILIFIFMIAKVDFSFKFVLMIFICVDILWGIMCMLYAHSLENTCKKMEIPECNTKSTDLDEIIQFLAENEPVNDDIDFLEKKFNQIVNNTKQKTDLIEIFLRNSILSHVNKKINVFEDLFKKMKFLEIQNKRIEKIRVILDKIKYKIENIEIEKLMNIYKEYSIIYNFFREEKENIRFSATKSKKVNLCRISIRNICNSVVFYDELYGILIIGGIIFGFWFSIY